MQSFSSILGATLPMGSKRIHKIYTSYIRALTEELIFQNKDTKKKKKKKKKKNCLGILVPVNN